MNRGQKFEVEKLRNWQTVLRRETGALTDAISKYSNSSKWLLISVSSLSAKCSVWIVSFSLHNSVQQSGTGYTSPV